MAGGCSGADVSAGIRQRLLRLRRPVLPWLRPVCRVPDKPAKKQDIVIINYPKNPNEDYSANPSEAPSPLYFQKSTWLRAKVYTHGSDNGFKGWSAIMGFMYPYTYYKKYMDDLGLGLSGNDAIAWNLFPVFRKQLEAYATVYCYFDRKGGLGTTFDPTWLIRLMISCLTSGRR